MIDDEKVYSLDLEVLHLFNIEELNNTHYYTLFRKTGLECKFLIHDLGLDGNSVVVSRRRSKSYDPSKYKIIDCITLTKVVDHRSTNVGL